LPPVYASRWGTGLAFFPTMRTRGARAEERFGRAGRKGGISRAMDKSSWRNDEPRGERWKRNTSSKSRIKRTEDQRLTSQEKFEDTEGDDS